LLTGGRWIPTLDLARRFHEEGHTVFTADSTRYHICRFSNSVEQNFLVPSPRFQGKQFVDALIEIAEKNEIDLVIPMFEEIFCFSKALHRFPKSTQVFCSSHKTLDILHNKWLFNEKLHSMGVTAPQSFLVKTYADLERIPLSYPFILKPCYSRAAQHVVRINRKEELRPISIDPDNPWVAQEWLNGNKFCTYSVASKGKLTAHAIYPHQFSIDDSSCLNFEAVEHPGALEWVKQFVEKENFTGQIAFDFIECANGHLYAIECNPRSTSGLHLFQNGDDLPRAFLNEKTSLVTPKIGFAKQIAAGMLLYGWKEQKKEKSCKSFLKKVTSVPDVIFSKNDLNPFLIQPFLFITYIVRCIKLRMPIPAMFTFDIDWNGEASNGREQITLSKREI